MNLTLHPLGGMCEAFPRGVISHFPQERFLYLCGLWMLNGGFLFFWWLPKFLFKYFIIFTATSKIKNQWLSFQFENSNFRLKIFIKNRKNILEDKWVPPRGGRWYSGDSTFFSISNSNFSTLKKKLLFIHEWNNIWKDNQFLSKLGFSYSLGLQGRGCLLS